MKIVKKKRIAAAIFGVAALVIVGVAIYAYRNVTVDITGDRFLERKGARLGFSEKQFQLADGSVLNYGEGPNNGPPLLLLHGQMVSWENYHKVLPELAKHYHVYALDYYGHGGSSKDPNKYRATAISRDVITFIEQVIGQPAVISGHSSGALLSALIAAEAPSWIRGVILEDGPFFSTEKDRAPTTYAGLGFKTTHDFLNQTEETNYLLYLLEHDYMQNLVNQGGDDIWQKTVLEPAIRHLERQPGTIPRFWYYPPTLNSLYVMGANLQDGTGEYDLRFGETFFDYSWFEGFDQAEVLQRIQAPTIVLHVAPSEQTAPSYYDDNGILLAAMDEKDAARVVELLPDGVLMGGFESMHNIHDDCPKEFTRIFVDFLKRIE